MIYLEFKRNGVLKHTLQQTYKEIAQGE